jgi:hypothetical protein
LPEYRSDKPTPIDFILDENSEVLAHFFLKTANNAVAFQIRRDVNSIVDEATVTNDNNWVNQIPQDRKVQTIVKLTALVRRYLHALDAEATLKSDSDTEWSRYRDAQQAILYSLEQTQTTLLTEFNKKALELEANTIEKMQKRETELSKKYDALNGELTNEHKARLEAINAREDELKKREGSFNTKEARYVARTAKAN